MVWETIRMQSLSKEFVPENTFFIGQVFNWFKSDSEIFCGTLGNKLLEIRINQNDIQWKLTPSGTEEEIRNYLNLDKSLATLTERWKKDPFFDSVYKSQPGVRILKQPIFECLISFILSQNSHVKKIASSIQSLKEVYGKTIEIKHNRTWYSFPSVQDLSKADIDTLKNFGLGYRAGYVVSAVERIIEKGGEIWLDSLHEMETEEIKEELLAFDGIGPKVADCILLFGFNRFEVVPIDVHMWRIAKENYGAPHVKNVSGKVYKQTAKRFVNKLGDHAGWAHSILYAASLRKELPKRNKK